MKECDYTLRYELQQLKDIFSSNVNEVTKAILNYFFFSFFFIQEEFTHTKSTKSTKSKKKHKKVKNKHKKRKKHKKHKKCKKGKKREKHKTPNKRLSSS